MADFSKQYNDITKDFPEGAHDFDYDLEFNKLSFGKMTTGLLCEGLGTCAIAKTVEGDELILVVGDNPSEGYWAPYKKYLEEFKSKINSNQ